MFPITLADFRDRTRWAQFADGVVVALAISLPWSTSATSILAVVWLIAVIPSIEMDELGRVLKTVAGALPVILLALGVIGMLWADAPWRERFESVEDFTKLLTITLMMVQFRRPDQAQRVFVGYLVSCAVLLALSSTFALWPEFQFLYRPDRAVPVKNASIQSGEFLICIFGVLYVAADLFRQLRIFPAALLTALALGFTLNILYVATSRTVLVQFPILLLLLGFKKFSRTGLLALFGVAVVIAAVAWNTSSYLRDRTKTLLIEYQQYDATNKRTSTGERIEFWKKSADFVARAPVFGHGTGSINGLFRESAAGRSGASGVASTNPHNQTFATAIQIGVIGAAIMWAMWIAHLLLFRGNGLIEWIGLVVVVQNIVGSLFNSHLFDFAQGWTYVIGVGVAGGVVLRALQADSRGSG